MENKSEIMCLLRFNGDYDQAQAMVKKLKLQWVPIKMDDGSVIITPFSGWHFRTSKMRDCAVTKQLATTDDRYMGMVGLTKLDKAQISKDYHLIIRYLEETQFSTQGMYVKVELFSYDPLRDAVFCRAHQDYQRLNTYNELFKTASFELWPTMQEEENLRRELFSTIRTTIPLIC